LFRRGKFPPDEYGFVVDPELARELRDCKLKLACLKLDKKRTPYAIAQEARTLHARIEEIRRSLQCPCPSRYGRKQLKSDNERLKIFGDWRVQKNLFPPEEDLEEARRTARLDSFLEGPELITRQRLANLRDKKRVADRGGPSQDSNDEPPPYTTARSVTVPGCMVPDVSDCRLVRTRGSRKSRVECLKFLQRER
jgi:hypothetical protein